jgi:mannose-1-phosphate guanylyltransferase
VVETRPALVALVGIEPSSAESDYGWIEPAPACLPTFRDVFPVVRFVEKPPPSEVRELMARGCLWNSFVMAGRVDTLLELIARMVPDLCRAFDPLRRVLGTEREDAVLEAVYASLPKIGFSRRVLAPARGRLATVRARGVQWSDWGSPGRVIASIRGMRAEPPWLAAAEEAAG